MGGWLYPEDPGDYSTDNFLWVDPLTVMDELGLDPGNPDDVILATELVAEASMILDGFTNHMYGPARCVAATYRLRGFPLLNFAPPIGTVHGVVRHHDKCLPPDDVYTPDLVDPGVNPLAYQRGVVMQLAQQGVLVGTPTAVLPAQGIATSGAYYCVDTPSVMKICGIPRYGMQWGVSSCGGNCAGSELITVLYRSRANWPPGLTRIFMALLEGLLPDSEGECAVPSGTTSVTRQGVTWSTEMTEGLIGVPTVDEWVFRNRRKIRLKDPMHAELVYTRYYDCTAAEPYVVTPTGAFAGAFGAETTPQPILVDPLGEGTMISPYSVVAQLACHLDSVAAGSGFGLPASGTGIQRRMGPNVFACAGVSVAVTSVQAAPPRPNCPPDPRYAIDAGIARTCAVEFNKDGQTLNPVADMVSQTMSLDAAMLWEAFANHAPLTTFQITGGLSVVSCTFQVSEFDLPMCVYPQTQMLEFGLQMADA